MLFGLSKLSAFFMNSPGLLTLKIRYIIISSQLRRKNGKHPIGKKKMEANSSTDPGKPEKPIHHAEPHQSIEKGYPE